MTRSLSLFRSSSPVRRCGARPSRSPCPARRRCGSPLIRPFVACRHSRRACRRGSPRGHSSRAMPTSRRAHQRRAHATPLPGVRHDQRQHPRSSDTGTRERRATPAISASPCIHLGDERELAVVVDVADPGQPLVRGPLGERRSTPYSARTVSSDRAAWKRDHGGLVLGADRPDDERHPVLGRRSAPVLARDTAGSRAAAGRHRRPRPGAAPPARRGR